MKEVMEIASGNILLEILAPASNRAIETSYRCKADTEASLSIIAILRYKQDTSRFPSTLEQLVDDGYLQKVPIDPWSDKPLVYRKTLDGFILYGVGTNFTDDVGQIARDDQGEVKKWADEGDWVFWPISRPKSSEEWEKRLEK